MKLELLQSVGKQCHRVISIVTQILTVSPIERGGLGLVPSTFSLGAGARMAAASADTGGREVSLATCDVTATGDRGRIRTSRWP